MLTLTGKYLGTNTEKVVPKPGQTWAAFDRTVVDVLVKGKQGSRVEACEVVRDFPMGSLPPVDQEVVLEVSVDAFRDRYRLRALSVVGARPVAVVGQQRA